MVSWGIQRMDDPGEMHFGKQEMIQEEPDSEPKSNSGTSWKLSNCSTSSNVHQLLLLSYQGNSHAREELFIRSLERLRTMARQMFHEFPKLLAMEQTDDILNKAVLRLHRSLDEVKPQSARDFFGLASLQMRRVLADLARYYSVRSVKYKTNIPPKSHLPGPLDMHEWSEFHEAIGVMDPGDQELFHLLFYQGLRIAEAADMLGESSKVIRRRWREAKVRLSKILDGKFPSLENEYPIISPRENL